MGRLGPLPSSAQTRLLAEAGIDGWELVRSGHNAVYRSPDGALVAKVYGEESRCSVDVLGATLAREVGVCVPDLVDVSHPQVAVWRWVRSTPTAAHPAALTRLARDVRRLAGIPVAAAPAHWLDNITTRAAALTDPDCPDDPDARWLAGELSAVAASDIALRAPLAFQHGDLTMGNVVYDGRRAHVVDFETIRAAPVEWDVACLRVSAERHRSLDPAALQTFMGALDPVPDPEVLACCVRAKELLNVSWLYVMREQPPDMVSEMRLRVRSLRDGLSHRWRELAVLAQVPAQPARREAPTSRSSTSVVENASSEV